MRKQNENPVLRLIASNLSILQKAIGLIIAKATKIFSAGIGIELSKEPFMRNAKEVAATTCSLYQTERSLTYLHLHESACKLNPQPYLTQEQLTEFCSLHKSELQLSKMTLCFIKEDAEIYLATVIRVTNNDGLTVYIACKIGEKTTGGVAKGFHVIIPNP